MNGPGGEDRRALDDVAQLAHVARPRVLLEHPHRLVIHAGDRLLVARVELVDERLRSAAAGPPCARAAAAAGTQTRSAGSRDPRAACRLCTASTGSMLVAAITRTSTDCSVRPPRRRNLRSCSTRSSLTCVAGVISPISSRNSVPRSASSKQPCAAIGRAGERALLVAEDLALEQRLRNRRAVDRDERKRRARAELVDRLRDQLLAGARLAGDQHRRAGRRRLLDHLVDLPHLRAVADQRSERAVLAQLTPQRLHLAQRLRAARRSCRGESSGAGCRPAW